MRMTRGMRNNNPFNIRRSVTRWEGKFYSGKDKSFEVFTSMDYGIRAGIVTLRTYVCVHKLTSVKAIINRFAPSTENDTSVYISFCEKRLSDRGYDPNNIKYGDMAFFTLCSSMMVMESKYYLSPSKIYSIALKFNLI
jgi:hypothetical protein